MKSLHGNLLFVAAVLMGLAQTSTALSAGILVTIVNPSFELPNNALYPTSPVGYPPSPGYETNAATGMPGWSGTSPDSFIRIGINGANATNFANNGIIPNGSYVAFLQDASPTVPTTLSQTLPNLLTGFTYTLTFADNARAGQSPHLTVTIGDQTLESNVTVTSVGAGNPYHSVSLSFVADVAAASSPVLTFGIVSSGDDSLLLDNIALTRATPEPSSLILCGLGAIGLLVAARRRRKA